MSTLIRILFALQICILFVAGCAVDEDVADDTELTSSDVADVSDAEAAAADDVPEEALDGEYSADSVTTKALCTSFRLNNRATIGTCRSHCSSRGQTALAFDNRTKICRCCSPGPL